MTAKVLYFTKTAIPDVEENAEIAAIAVDRLVTAPVDIQIRNRQHSTSYGGELEDCDFVAGTVPEIEFYEEKPTFDPEEFVPPVGNDQVVLTNGQSVIVGGSVYTFTIIDGEITVIDVEPEE